MLLKTKFWFCLLAAYCIAAVNYRVLAQDESDCPDNIGFENGDFGSWKPYTGSINSKTNQIDITQPGEVSGRHTIIPSTDTGMDPYGNFPVICPNGSNYSVMLGNNATGGQAEKLTYTFKVPDNAADYTLIYNYAVVFQNPGHAVEAQPKFTVNVYDDQTNQLVGCGSHDFAATSNLPGFALSKVGAQVWYKPWSPVSINFLGYSGKTIRIEFATNDCGPGGHFGYAYLDVNENCSSPITGNTICPGLSDKVILKAPGGFKEYYWYDANFQNILGNGNTLTISPAPPLNTVYALRIVPFPELGCLDTVYTSINTFEGSLELNVAPPGSAALAGCKNVGVDLTNPAITAGSTPKFKFTYHTDPAGEVFLAGAKGVKTPGTYYIKATNSSGCFLIKPVQVQIFDPPVLVVNNPPPVCKPATIDLTASAITKGSGAGITYSYWKDASATIPLTTPRAVDETGIYYIQAILPNSCPLVKPVIVTIGEIPILTIAKPNFQVCDGESLTESDITAGSQGGLSYTFWTDNTFTTKLPSLADLTTSGTYYVKASNSSGCILAAPFKVTFYPPLSLIISSEHVTVDYPETVDLNTMITPVAGLAYTYWLDSAATKPAPNPTRVVASGKFFVKAANANDCNMILPLEVTVIPPPLPVVKSVNGFTPNGDGANEIFRMDITGIIRINYFKVFDRWGQVVFSTQDGRQGWDGKKNGGDAPTGTYYWVFDGYDDYYQQKISTSGSVVLVR